MNKKPISDLALYVILIAAIAITVPILVQIRLLHSNSSYITDYKGKFVNSAGEKFEVEIIRDRDDPDSKWLTISKDKFRNVSLFDLKYTKPKEALPQDIRFIDIDAERNLYMFWVYQKDGSEIIKYSYPSRYYYHLDSEISDLDKFDIHCINDIEENNALDSLPDADIHKAKWENYFSRLKQEYEESTDTSSKEDNV
jgi:hypothetical protein